MSTDRIPFLDLVTVHHDLREELLAVYARTLDTAGFIGGPMVDDFERAFAAFCDTRFCVGMANGTDALRLALIAAGVEPGDTVVTVPMTFIATVEAISQAGGLPDFVDIDPVTSTMDPARLRAYVDEGCTRNRATGRLISKRTGRPVTAVVPVHLYGQIADMDPILAVASEFGLVVVEDACQAHGAEYWSQAASRWRTAGAIGRVAAFSFYPGKNLGACGEAGAITTDDEEIARRCRMLRDHGQSQKYVHVVEGYNARLDALQAGILSVKLRHLPAWNEQRRQHARAYDAMLADADGAIVRPCVPEWSRPVHHLYAVHVPNRDRVQDALTAAGIGTGIHYPIPLHRARPYETLGYRSGDFPVAEQTAAETLSLPMFPGLCIEQQWRVAAALAATVERHDARAPLRVV